MSTLIVGTIAFDSLETPFGKAERIIGGSATYIGMAASFFSDRVDLVSVIGGDFPKEKLQALKDRGMALDGVEVRSDERSFFWSGRYHNDMNTRDTLDTQLNVLADFKPVVPESARHPEFLMLGNLTPSVQIDVIQQLESRPKLIVLDTMNYWIAQTLDELKHALTMVDVLTINDEEARELSGEYSIVKAARKILKMGPRILIIKKGEHGALLFNEREVFFAPALPLEDVYDPTGAGDTFAGGFVGYLDSTKDISFENMKRAILYGSAMASFCVEQFGTQRLETLTDQEIATRIQQFIGLCQVEIELN